MPAAPDFSRARGLIHASRARHVADPERVRGARVPYFRRGVMSIPGFRMAAGGDPKTDGRAQSLRMLGKAATLPVDFFFFDLEDAAPDHPDLKPLARDFVVEALTTLDFGRRVRAFRPNALRSEYFEDDIVRVVGEAGGHLDAMVLPKCESADEVRDVADIVRAVQAAAGRDRRIPMEVLIESPRAFLEADRIAALEDVSALVFGAWDFARTIGGRVDAARWLTDQAVARQTLPIIAAAYEKDAVDAVTATLPIRPKASAPDAPEGDVDARVVYETALALAKRDAEDARRLGYAAKWILHPDQIEPVQGAFTPPREEALRALHLAADYAAAARRGSGAEVHAGQLADKAVVATEWWDVRAALAAGVLTDADVATTGLSFAELSATVAPRR